MLAPTSLEPGGHLMGQSAFVLGAGGSAAPGETRTALAALSQASSQSFLHVAVTGYWCQNRAWFLWEDSTLCPSPSSCILNVCSQTVREGLFCDFFLQYLCPTIHTWVDAAVMQTSTDKGFSNEYDFVISRWAFGQRHPIIFHQNLQKSRNCFKGFMLINWCWIL